MKIEILEASPTIELEDKVNYIIQINDAVSGAGISPEVIEATGDLIIGLEAGVATRRAIGTTGQVLGVSGGVPTWITDPAKDLVTAAGDLLYGTEADVLDNLAIGSANKILIVSGGLPAWSSSIAPTTITTGDIVINNGGTIGQAAGPLMTFDDSNNYLEITGANVGVGTATPRKLVDLLSTSQAQLRLSYTDNSVYADLSVASTGNLTIAPTGDLIFNPTGDDILPANNYDLNLGSRAKKYLSIAAAELRVDTLVAQDTIATIGGRILVGPTTVLTSDLASGNTTIYVAHNEMASGDRVYMEANGQVEFMSIDSAPGGAGPYSYTVTRNLDGSGANDWSAGDAVFNTGTTGDGFIDLYSFHSMRSATQYGPTIVGNVRTGTTYNNLIEHWAVGNLDGLYGYSGTTYGAAFGRYANSRSWISVDDTNGVRIMNGLSTVIGQWDASGNLTLGQVATNQGNAYWNMSNKRLEFRGSTSGTTVQAYIDTDGSLVAGGGDVSLNSNGLTIVAGALADKNKIKFINGSDNNILSIYSEEVLAISTGTILQGAFGAGVINSQFNINVVAADLTTCSISVYAGNGGTSEISLDGQVIINKLGANVDFRVESDTQTHSLFVQGSDGFVGLNNDAPSAQLDVVGNVEVNGFLLTPTGGELTISGGVVTATASRHTVDTEGDAATDDLDTINGGVAGAILILSSAANTRDITLKDNTGNLQLAGDFTLLLLNSSITLYYNGANWIELSRSSN